MRRLDALMKAHAGLQSFARQASELTQLQQLWKDSVPPPLEPYCQVGSLRQRRITIFADNGAVAAKLKLLTPTLMKNLQNKGLEVTSIRVEVQVPSRARPSQHAKRKLSLPASDCLRKMAETLPDSPLRLALERLSKRI